MGLGQLLTRLAGADRAGGRRAGPGSQPPRVLPQSVTERTALSVPGVLAGPRLVCGGSGRSAASAPGGASRRSSRNRRSSASRTRPRRRWRSGRGSPRPDPLRQLGVHHRRHRPARLSDRPETGAPAAGRGPLTGNPVGAGRSAAGIWPAEFYDVDEVWHVKSFLHRTGRPLGIGLLDGVMGGISAAQALQDYRASFFASGGIPSGIIKVDRPGGRRQGGGPPEIGVGRRSSRAPRSRPCSTRLTDFTPIAFNPVDSQMIEAAELDRSEIAFMWGLPPSQLGRRCRLRHLPERRVGEQQTREAIARGSRLLEQADQLSICCRAVRTPNGSSTPICGPTL